ncbi:MAG: hypothetical protein RSB59_04985 [Clostridia bacterium]
MSKIINKLVELISEEIEGAEEYAKLANFYKMDRLELARDFATKAEEELKHALCWHEWVVKEIELKKVELKNKGEEVPLKMLVRYEIEHENFIEEYNEVKRELAIYKGQ